MNISQFQLPATGGRILSEKSLLGRWCVIYFYPRDLTPGCTVQAQDFSALYEEYQKLGCEVIGVNDNPMSQHEKFCTKVGIPYPLLTDEGLEFLKACNVYGPKKFMGKVFDGILRTTLIVNPQGQVVKRYDQVKTKGHAQTVLNDLKALIG